MSEKLTAEITEIIDRTHDVKSIRFKVAHKGSFKPGQYFYVTLDGNKDLKHHLSISNSPTEMGFLEFTKKLTGSDFSERMKTLKAGDKADLKYPYGNFVYTGEPKKIAFLSGGIGITPIRSIVKYAYDRKLDSDIALIYGNRTEADIAFKEELDAIASEYKGFKICHILSEEDSPHYRSGLITEDVVKAEIPDYQERKFFICGPPKMVEAMQDVLLDRLGLDEKMVITENFSGY